MLFLCRDSLEKIMQANKDVKVLDAAVMNALKEKVKRAVDGIRETRNTRNKAAATDGKKTLSPYRTQYLSFLRCCWLKLPNIRFLHNHSNYECAKTEDGESEGSYKKVVEVVAKAVHEFLFLGLTEVRFAGYTDCVRLYSVEGMCLETIVALFSFLLLLCCIRNCFGLSQNSFKLCKQLEIEIQ